MNDVRPIIRKGRKYEQVLESARVLFLSHGFESIGVDDIARKAEVSKATLYSYFPDKRILFMEVARIECARHAARLEAEVDETRPIDEVLRGVGRGFLRIILSEFGRNMFRVCVAEGERFPELGRQFFESGPGVMHARMVEFLGCAAQRGELQIEDLELAADQFPELCKAGIHFRLLFGIDTEVSDQEIERVVNGAVETFMARYGGK